jgi:protein-L-isoaspartate(D-aspartate) O-methyltransferase
MPSRRQDSSRVTGPIESDLLATLRAEGIRTPRLLEAVRTVRRAEFVPEDAVDLAYHDVPLRIPHDQVTTQPSLVAKMVDALGLTGTELVLEVGTGYGWQTALLARLAREVWSIERWPDLAETARDNLSRHGAENVTVLVDDGTEGLAEQAPFDAILVSAAFPAVPDPLTEQLAVGGRLVQPIGPGGADDVVLFERRPDGLVKRRTITGARFVRLVGRRAFRP